MGELGLNKILGAVLATALFILGVNELATGVFGGGGHHDDHEYESLNEWAAASFPGFHVEIAEAVSAGPDEEEEIFDLGLALASADISAGESAMRQCAQCHSWNEGGVNGTGPNLYGIMGQDIAAVSGFNYSGALSGVEGAWTYDKMNAWLENPSGYVRGNKMSYAGLRSPRRTDERVNIIAYLASISPNAPAFPAPIEATGDAAVDVGEN
ncbi:MAG: c-type cytochrome [Pseudomonadota bacterium]